MIVSKTPLRVSFLGGGTDFPEFFTKHGGAVITTTLRKYIYVCVEPRFDDQIRVSYTRTELVRSAEEVKHPYVREALKTTGVKKGIEIVTVADVPSNGSGLGASSALMVGLLKALWTYQGEERLDRDLAHAAFDIERHVLGKSVGVQDHYAAALGGMRWIWFNADGIMSRRIRLSVEQTEWFEENVLLFHTNVVREAESVLAEQRENIPNRIEQLCGLRDLAMEYGARLQTVEGHLQLPSLLDRAWELKKTLASTVSNPEIEWMIEKARQQGAVAWKVCGAGAGGYLMLLVPPECRGRVRAVLSTHPELKFRLEPQGSTIVLNEGV